MYARATWAESSKDQIEARLADYPRRMKSIRESPGCVGIAALINRETGAAVSVSYWESKEAMLASEAAGEQIRNQVQAEGTQVRDMDRFDVILQDRVAPPNSRTFVRVNDFVAPPDKSRCMRRASVYVRSSSTICTRAARRYRLPVRAEM
jgi:heme-degrading monooxygenase HmoA